METVITIIMILICCNFLFKQTFEKIIPIACTSVVCALFVGLSWHYAIEQSKSQIADLLANSTLMLDIAVLIAIDITLQLTYCILTTKSLTLYNEKPVSRWKIILLKVISGVQIFPILFYILALMIFKLPGVSFSLTAWILACVVLITIPLFTWIIKKILPEKDIRLELIFHINIIIGILGIVSTMNGRTAIAGVDELNLKAFACIIILIVAGIIGGTIIYKIKTKHKIKNL
ncbi:MAG: hypothetical protein ACI3ZZ_06820 [Candidatus Aphodosoma sp.]